MTSNFCLTKTKKRHPSVTLPREGGIRMLLLAHAHVSEARETKEEERFRLAGCLWTGWGISL